MEFFRILLEIGLVRKSILGKMTIRIRLRFVNDFGAFAGISSLMPQTSWIAGSEHWEQQSCFPNTLFDFSH